MKRIWTPVVVAMALASTALVLANGSSAAAATRAATPPARPAAAPPAAAPAVAPRTAVSLANGAPVGVAAGDYLLTVSVASATSSTLVGAVVQLEGGAGNGDRVAAFHAPPSGTVVTAQVRVTGPLDKLWVVTFAPTTLGPLNLTPASWGYVVRGTSFTSATNANLVWHGINADPDYIDPQAIPILYTYTRANSVRVMVDECKWLPFFTTAYSAAYRQEVINTVNQATANGKTAILDLHFACADSPTATAYAVPQVGPDQHSLAFWTDAAALFASNHQVLYELFNEPQMNTGDIEPDGRTGTQAWRDGGTLAAGGYTWTTPGMQALYNAVRATGASNVVLVDGTGYAGDLTAAEYSPVDGTNLAYAYHAYTDPGMDPSVCNTNMNQAILPVIDPNGRFREAALATEFGTGAQDVAPSNVGSSFLASCIQWFNQYSPGWMVYGWFPTWLGRYGLLANWPMAQTSRASTVMARF